MPPRRLHTVAACDSDHFTSLRRIESPGQHQEARDSCQVIAMSEARLESEGSSVVLQTDRQTGMLFIGPTDLASYYSRFFYLCIFSGELMHV